MSSALSTTVSSVFTIIAGVASILALASLITLYTFIKQLSIARKHMEEAKGRDMIGEWHNVAIRRDSCDDRLSAQVPFISLPGLVEHDSRLEPPLAPHRLLKNQHMSGWANFLDCLRFSPALIDSLAELRPCPVSTENTTSLIEKRLPMRWNGNEFVSLCAALGFQQETRNNRGGEYQFNILPLPALWFSPLGHFTIIKAKDGLVVSFRPRTYERPRLPRYQHPTLLPAVGAPAKFCLRTRAFYAVNSLPTGPGNQDIALFFGGRRSWEIKPIDATKEKRLRIVEGEIYNTVEADLIQTWGLNHEHFSFLRFDDLPLNGAWPCEGLRIGKFVIPAESGVLLRYIKSSLLELAPDGYVFTAHEKLTSHLDAIFNHAYGLETRECLSKLRTPANTGCATMVLLNSALEAVHRLHTVYPTMNDLQAAALGVEDCKTITRLVQRLRQLYTSKDGNAARGRELRWALICRPDLVRHLSAELRNQSQRLDDMLNPGEG
ncbi:hypothetical protein C8A03DRAFT_19991, partial [Achaetomium macrosporum]